MLQSSNGLPHRNQPSNTSAEESRNESHTSPQILEHGDIFFYRPKVGVREVKGIDDIRRFLWLLRQIAGHLLVSENQK